MMHKMKGAQGLIHAGHKDRFALIENQFKKVLAKYPGSDSRGKRRRMDKEIKTIIEEEEEGEDEDEQDGDKDEEEDDEESFNQYSDALDAEVKRKLESQYHSRAH